MSRMPVAAEELALLIEQPAEEIQQALGRVEQNLLWLEVGLKRLLSKQVVLKELPQDVVERWKQEVVRELMLVMAVKVSMRK
jgi:hypothetical protein